MKINFWILLIFIISITGCTIQTTGNVIISDGSEMPEIPEDIIETTTTTVQAPEEDINGTVQDEEEIEITNTTEEEQLNETTTTTAPEIIGNLINIENLKFVPDSLTMDKGETVTWLHKDKYVDNMKHMVRIYPGGAASPTMFYGESFSYTFDEPGEYTIVDVIYAKKNVKMDIIVE